MLSVLVWFPLFGVLLLALLPKSIDANKYARSVALVVAGLVFVGQSILRFCSIPSK